MAMLRHRALAAPLLLLGISAVAQAHDTWLLPDTLRTRIGRHVHVGLTSGMGFPADDIAIQPARVVRAEARLAGVTRPLARPRAGKRALYYAWTPRVPGVATLVVALAPRALTMRPDLVREYLDEIDADSAVRAQWQPASPTTPWREVYEKHAKTFVLVEAAPEPSRPRSAPAADSGWREPTGLTLELVPLRDPTRLAVGDTLTLRVLHRGRPLAGFAVAARGETRAGAGHAGAGAASRAAYARSDTAGLVRVPLTSPGRWLLTGTYLRRVHEPSVDWRSDFTTLTLAVSERRMR